MKEFWKKYSCCDSDSFVNCFSAWKCADIRKMLQACCCCCIAHRLSG